MTAEQRAQNIHDAYYAGDMTKEEAMGLLIPLIAEHRVAPDSHSVLRRYMDNTVLAEAFLMPQVYDV